MAILSPQISDAVVSACQTGAAEAGAALSRTFDVPLKVELGPSGVIGTGGLSKELDGPGLAVVFFVGGSAAILALPEASGLLPSWYAAPDATGQSKLATLAQELGMLLLPEDCMPDDGKAFRVVRLGDAIRRGGMSDEAIQIAIRLVGEGKEATASLIWPLSNPSAVADPIEKKAPAKAAATSAPGPKAVRPVAPASTPRRRSASLDDLPVFSKSLLKIRVPVRVTLAEHRQPLQRIIELGPGSIIQFEKSCEENLDLEVGNCKIAAGEAVKVGDKFGLRITSIVLPDERFLSVKPTKARSAV